VGMEGANLPHTNLAIASIQVGLYRRMLLRLLKQQTGLDWSSKVGPGIIVHLPHEGKAQYLEAVTGPEMEAALDAAERIAQD